MLGQAHAPRRRLGMAVLAFAVLALPAVGGADSTPSADALRRENARLAAQSRAAVLSLYSLDSRLARARARLAAVDAQALRLRRERASLARQLAVARAGVRLSQQRLASRLRLLYEQRDVSALEVVLGATSLREALAGLEDLDRVTSLDESVLAQVTAARRQLAEATDAAADRARRLASLRRDAAATSASLARARDERRRLLSSLAVRRRVNDGAIARLEAASATATARATELVSVDAPARAAAGRDGFADRELTVTATGYALEGATSTGLAAGWGVAAVDPAVIPLGAKLAVPGYGEAVAADTGGAVAGATIDLWFPTAAQARAWGRRTVTVVLH